MLLTPPTIHDLLLISGLSMTICDSRLILLSLSAIQSTWCAVTLSKARTALESTSHMTSVSTWLIWYDGGCVLAR